MRDWCSECKFENFGGSQEPCYNCVTTYNKKPSEFTPASDEVRGVGEWITTRTWEHDGDPYCSNCGFEQPYMRFEKFKFCPNCGARMEVSGDV